MENAKRGETIAFKSSETLTKEGTQSNGKPDDLSLPASAPGNPEVEGKTFAAITGRESLETKTTSSGTNLPESVSAAQIADQSRKYWSQQDPEAA